MRNTLMIFLLLLNWSASAQTNSWEWLNLKEEVKLLLQVKYRVDKSTDSLVIANSDQMRFGNTIFRSTAQPLLIDNSYLEFSREGRVEKWIDFNYRGEVRNQLLCNYSDHLLPNELIIKDGQDTALKAHYTHDNMGRFQTVEMSGIVATIQRDSCFRVITEDFASNNKKTSFQYKYLPNGMIQIEFRDGSQSPKRLKNQFNPQGDLVFDGEMRCEYEYDARGNWISKRTFRNKQLINLFTREIQYY